MDKQTQEFGASVSGVMASLGDSAETMRRTSDEMARAVEQTRASAIGTARGADDSARNLAAVAAATEQLTGSVGEIARQVAQATAVARVAVDRAETTDTTVRGLSQAAGQIGEVVRLIADIASRTNLLALNATIEAARAGAAGKGFAVVAAEVKQLAEQTARATGQIESQVSGMQDATARSVDAVRDVGEAIGQMDRMASAIAAAVEQQGAATQEISMSVQTVSRQTEEAKRMMTEVSDVADGAGRTSQGVLRVAEEVAQIAASLRTEVDEFLAVMQAGNAQRRRYERIPGNGMKATLLSGKMPATQAEVMNLSRGGVALMSEATLEPGANVTVTLAGTSGAVAGRVERAAGGMLAIAFRQDSTNLQLIDRALDAVETARSRAKAA